MAEESNQDNQVGPEIIPTPAKWVILVVVAVIALLLVVYFMR